MGIIVMTGSARMIRCWRAAGRLMTSSAISMQPSSSSQKSFDHYDPYSYSLIYILYYEGYPMMLWHVGLISHQQTFRSAS